MKSCFYVGYNSGDQSLTGVFSRIFVGLGTSFYTSENVIDGESVRLGGSVMVQLPSEQTNKINVMANDVAAVHLPSGKFIDSLSIVFVIFLKYLKVT